MEEIAHIPKRKTAPGTRCHCPRCEVQYKIKIEKRNVARRISRANSRKVRLDVAPLKSIVDDNPALVKYFPCVASWYNWGKYGIDPYVADKICIAIGMHPYEVFGEEWIEKIDLELEIDA